MYRNGGAKFRTYHLGLDKRLEGVDFLITLPLHQLDFTEGTLANDLQRAVILGTFGSSEETQEVGLLLLGGVLLLLLTGIRQFVAQTDALKLLRSVTSQYTEPKNYYSEYPYLSLRVLALSTFSLKNSPVSIFWCLTRSVIAAEYFSGFFGGTCSS